MRINKMPQLHEGILRETDRTDIMHNIANLGHSFKSGYEKGQAHIDSQNSGHREVSKEIEPLVKAAIRSDTRSATLDLTFLSTIAKVKAAQIQLDKAQKNIRDQQESFIKGIINTKAVKELGGNVFLVRMQKESMKGNGSVLTSPEAKNRYQNTFAEQAAQLEAVIMGYASSSTWSSKAVEAIKLEDKDYIKKLTGGQATGKPTQEAIDKRNDIETSIRAFTTITGELWDRLQAVRDKVEQRGKILKV